MRKKNVVKIGTGNKKLKTTANSLMKKKVRSEAAGCQLRDTNWWGFARVPGISSSKTNPKC